MSQFEDRHVLLGPIYELEGVPASLLLADGSLHGTGVGAEVLRVLDLTRGIVIDAMVDVQTMRPAAAARVGDLADLGITPIMLDDAILTLMPDFGTPSAWKVNSFRPRPLGPNGLSDGEVLLMLEGTSG